MLWKRISLVALLALASCAHEITLMPRGPGQPGHGSANAAMGDSGTLTIDLNGKTYTGRWVLVRGGGAGFATGYSGGNVATGSAYGADMSAPGQALLSAPDGSHLRCQFNYSSWSSAGAGQCQDDAGLVYDMMVR